MSYATCNLMDLIIDLKWDSVASRAKSNPLDAQYQTDELETPLYVACLFQPPSNVIQELVNAYPNAIILPQTKNRDTPLHIACRYDASYEVIEILLRTNPTCFFIKSKWGKTPLDAFAEAFSLCLLDHPTSLSRLEESNNINNSKKVEMIRKLELLLRSASTRNNPDYSLSSWTMLHAVFTVKNVPLCLIQYILNEYSHYAKMRDDQGRLPFHIAVSSLWRPRYNVNFILHELLRIYPQAARITYQGRFPLHLTLENGKTRWLEDGVHMIYASAPHLVSVCEDTTKFYPFMIAACSVKKPDINTIYNLLSAQPDILAGYIGNNEEKRRNNRLMTNLPRGKSENNGTSFDRRNQNRFNCVTVLIIFTLSFILFTMN